MSEKIKALIIIDHGSTVAEANNMLSVIVSKLKSHSESYFNIIEFCHMELAPPTLEEAFDNCIKFGANEIIVHPYFLVPGRHSKTDIPSMVNKLKSKYPDVICKITEPLGLHDKILDVILDRSNTC
jgi:sirohydrochlorin ferrochelatase